MKRRTISTFLRHRAIEPTAFQIAQRTRRAFGVLANRAGAAVGIASRPDECRSAPQGACAGSRLWMAVAVLVAALGLGACGDNLGSDEEEDTEGPGRRGRAGRGRVHDVDRAALHRQGQGRRRRAGRHDRGVRGRPASTSTTSRTSTATSRSSPSCGPSSRTASRRAGHHHRHRLDGEALPRPRLRPGLRQVGDPERRGEPAAESAEPRLRSRPLVHGAVAERAHGPRRAQGPRPRHHVDQRPLRSQVQGQGHHSRRAARHGAAGDDGRGHRPAHRDQGAVAGDDPEARTRSTPARSATSPATTTSTTCRAGYRGGDRLVRRRRGAEARQPGHRLRDARRGLCDLVRRHDHPGRAPNPGAAYEFMDYVYDPENAAQIAAYVYYDAGRGCARSTSARGTRRSPTTT